MEELFTDSPEIIYDDTFILYDSIEQPTEDTFRDFPLVDAPAKTVPEAEISAPESVEIVPDTEAVEESASAEETLTPTPLPVQAEDIKLILEEMQKIRETNTLMQADFQKQAERQNQYYQYSFIVLIMLFSALVIALLFSKIKV